MATADSAVSSSLVRDRNFIRLLIGQFTSDSGTAVTALALPLLALSQLQASAFEVSLLGAATTLPQLLISLWAGAIADRGDKRRLMLVSDTVRALLVLTVPVAAALHVLTFAQLLVVALFEATVSVFFSAAYSSYPPVLFLDGERLQEANGKLNASFSASLTIGPVLAGALVGWIGSSNAILADSFSYSVSVLMLLGIRSRSAAKAAEEMASKEKSNDSVMEGIRFVFSHRKFRSIALANSVDSFFLAAWNALWLLYVVRQLHWSPEAAGAVLGFGAIGGIAGSIYAGPMVKRFGVFRVLLASAFATAPCELVTLLVPPGAVGQVAVLAAFNIVMFCVFLYTTASRNYRQNQCPPQLLGRVMMTNRWLSWGSRPVGAIVGGAAGSWTDPKLTLYGVVVGLLLPPFILWWGAGGRLPDGDVAAPRATVS